MIVNPPSLAYTEYEKAQERKIIMKEYGTIETEHMGICKDCKETKTVRLFLTNEQEEVTVCVECYMNS